MGMRFEIGLFYDLIIYIKLKRSHAWTFTLLVCLFVSPSFYLVHFCQLLRYAHNRIVDIMKVYNERNNEQVQWIRYRNNFDFIDVYFCEATDSMQYRSPNVNQEFSNTNHFGSISDSLARLSASSEYMASVK